MSLCAILDKDSEMGKKVLEITKRISGSAKENQDITELCLLIDSEMAKLQGEREKVALLKKRLEMAEGFIDDPYLSGLYKDCVKLEELEEIK